MRRIVSVTFLVLSVLGIAPNLYAQGGLKDLINNTKKAVGGAVAGSGTSKGGALSETEIANGLKEALKVGAGNATNQLSAVNGFFGNAAIKVLMPPEARKVETALRSVGMGAQVDKAILAMNRAAEDASKRALPIFTNAITSITITDGLNILRGSNDAATQYLRGRTTNDLTVAFRPVVQQSLSKTNATRYWTDVMNLYNKLPTTRQKINPDLASYVTERALNGIFVQVAQEETKIRTNPAARVNDILKRVFGG